MYPFLLLYLQGLRVVLPLLVNLASVVLFADQNLYFQYSFIWCILYCFYFPVLNSIVSFNSWFVFFLTLFIDFMVSSTLLFVFSWLSLRYLLISFYCVCFSGFVKM